MSFVKPENNQERTIRANILIAEDSLTQAQKLTWLLEEAHYAVRCVRNGQQALQQMQQQMPDLLITDVVMPEMDGYELCQRVREAYGLELPVMLVTTLKSASDVLQGLKVGADNFLTKPYQSSYLLDQVDYLLSNRRLRGRRKMEMGIEIEFGGERHYITADRQQILDLLISTYHEAVHLNQELEFQSHKLRTTIQLQSVQLALADSLPGCHSMREVLTLSCQIIAPLTQIHAVWFSQQTTPAIWTVIAGQMPAGADGSEQPLCQCMLGMMSNAKTSVPFSCQLCRALQLQKPHLCIPVVALDGQVFAFNIVLNDGYGDYEDFRDSVSTFAHQIQTNLQRVALLTDLEGQVKDRTRQLEQSELRFRTIVESELFGVMLVDNASGQIVYQNATSSQMLAYPLEQSLLLQQLVIPDEALTILQLPLNQQLPDQPLSCHIRCYNGDCRPVLIKLSPLGTDTQTVIAAFIDMTELRKAQSRLQHMQRYESIANLTGGIAHDFNNLLTVIAGSIDELQQVNQRNAEQQAAIKTIKSMTQSGQSLTRQLLAFARRQPLAAEPVDVSQVLQGLAQFTQRLLGNKIQLDFRIDSGVWPVYTDYSQLESAILNLMLNARDAMPQGGKLTVVLQNVIAAHDQESFSDTPIQGDFVKIMVQDTGEGIAAENLAKIFEPFFTTKPEGKGTGMGLAMVFGFVKQSRGFLQVASEPGNTCFSLYFPPYKALAEVELDGPSEPALHGGDELILVVEDNPDILAILCRYIQSLGYRFITAADADSAFKLYQQHQQDIQLLLTDMNLSVGQSGIELIKAIRKLNSDLPSLLATGSGYDESDNDVVDLKRFRILRKPFRRHELAQCIAGLLSSDKAR